MEIKKRIDVDVYGCSIVVVVTDDMEKTMKKYFKKFKIQYEDGFYYGLFLPSSEKDHNTYHILFNQSELSLNTIAHETYHACYRILKDRGVGMDDEEPMAYLMGFLIQEVLTAIVKQKINISNGAK